MKRNRAPSTSEESDNGSNCTSWSQMSNSQRRRDGKRPSEVFRTDLITAMKLHDSYQLNPEDYYVLSDSWRQEWEKGVQVPVSPNSIPKPIVRAVAPKSSAPLFTRPKKLIRSWGAEASGLGYVGIGTLSEGTCRYDLNEEDVYWLEEVNKEFTQMGMPQLDENTMEKVMEEFERRCYDNMSHAMETEEGLGIEYDEDVVCDVCQSPDGEDGNEMVFCDKCNICVHQACYGILKVPEGSWLCRTCALGISPKCQLCPKKGGAMKPTRSGSKWVHVSCALWIPEVSIGNPEKMEPITSVSQIPNNRWALICCLCKEKTGACIQCSAKSCRVAFHVTCGLQFNLKMNTILTEDDEVKFKSFCPTHSGLDWPDGDEGGGGAGARGGATTTTRGGAATLTTTRDGDQSDGARLSQRKLRLQQLEDEFYRYASPDEVANQMRLSAETVDFLFQYWKLKRKANFNQPLVTPKREEEESLARREQEVLLRRLRLFTHLRQDLERVRNLTYMVTRREKIKRSVCRVQEQIFHHHVRLLEQGRLSGVSSTRRLEEALFYFRATPPSSTSSLQPLRGHTQNGAAHVSPKRSFQRHGALKRSHHGDGQHLDHANSEATACRGQHCDGVRTAEPHPPEEEEKLRRRRKKRKRRWVWEQKLASKVVVEAEGASPIDNVPKNSDVVVHSGYNGSLRRTNPGQQGASPGNNKTWGNFRIPKRTAGMGRDEAEGRDFTSSGPVTSLDASPAPKPTPPIRTRLRTGAEPRPLATEQKKRCHAQRLRNHHPIAQRYGSEVLRCGVLAS